MNTPKDNACAILTIYGAPKMPKPRRVQVARWLRSQADFLEAEAHNYTPGRYTARCLHGANPPKGQA